MTETTPKLPITGSPLTASHILAQAYELLIPRGMWTKEMWVDVKGYDDAKNPLYTACSMGALLLVEHLEAERPLQVHWSEVDNEYYAGDGYEEDEESEWGPDLIEGEEETAVAALYERDPEFAKATKILANVVREQPSYVESGYTRPDTDVVVFWNDHPDTTWENVRDVFQEAIRVAERLS